METLHNAELEKAVLGAMMAWTPALAEGCDLFNDSDFHLSSHKVIYRALTQMAQTHAECDMMSLSEWLRSKKQLDAIGGFPYILHLDENRLPGSLKPHRAALRELSKRRSLLGALESAREAMEQGDTYAVASEFLQESLAAIADGGDDLVSAKDAAALVRESLAPDSERTTIPTGITLLDVRTGGGLRPGRLWVDGALPARGKSSLGRQIASYNARRGTPTLVFSIEMTVEEWFGIDAANEAGVQAWKIQEPQFLNAAVRENITAATEAMEGWPVWFDPNGHQTISKILSRARLAVLRHGIKLIVVDYLQRVEGGGKEELRTRIGKVAEKLAEFAKRYKVAVLLLSQLSRPQDINERPTMNKLKESGDIEAHAHVIILNYRPIDRETEKFNGEDELIVAKNRFGAPGTVHVTYNADKMQFQERTAY